MSLKSHGHIDPRNEESPGAGTPELSDITQNPTKGLNSMSNVTQINHGRNPTLQVCINVLDIINEIDGVWETIMLLDEKLEYPDNYDKETRRRYENCRILLSDLVTKNREKLVGFLEQRSAAERSGVVA